MGFFRKIFSKKKKEEERLEEKPKEEINFKEGEKCDHCKMEIHEGQRSKSYAGKKFHMKPCWFEVRKLAKSFT